MLPSSQPTVCSLLADTVRQLLKPLALLGSKHWHKEAPLGSKHCHTEQNCKCVAWSLVRKSAVLRFPADFCWTVKREELIWSPLTFESYNDIL